MAAIEFLIKVGNKTTQERNEFILASDLLGVSSLVDMINHRNGGGTTQSSLLGPFFVESAPMLEVGGDLIGNNDGEPVLVTGQVSGPDGQPVAGAMLEVWQNAANGLYDTQDPELSGPNLRCRMLTGEDGRYRFTTIKPISYTVPDDGPMGEILHAIGRHAWRPAHLHFKISAAGFQPLITEVFVADDPYIDEDAVFGVRSKLITAFKRLETAEEAASHGVEPGYCLVEFDVGLQTASD